MHLIERNQIIILLESDRKDLRWIKAVLLTSYSVPDEIVFQILGEKQLFNSEIGYILSKFPNQILRDCLNVYCGFPQPLSWLAVDHKNQEFWGRVMRHILMNETHIGFDICLQEFLNAGVSGFPDFWKDGIELWEKICSQTKEKKILLDSLIYNTANCSCDIRTTNSLWSILIESYTTSEDELISTIAENIEVLQRTGCGDVEDLFEILEKRFINNKVIPALFPDGILRYVLTLVESNSFIEEGEKVKILSTIMKVLENEPIRFFGTFNFFNNLSNNPMIPNEIKTKLQELPNVIDEVGKARLKEMEQKFEYKLDNWIGIN